MAPPSPPAAADVLLVLSTVPDVETGARMGRALVEERLAACVNVLPGVRSIYVWEGATRDDGEALCVIKTRSARFPELRDRLAALHPYELPEIIAVPLAEGSPPYLAWVWAQTGPA